MNDIVETYRDSAAALEVEAADALDQGPDPKRKLILSTVKTVLPGLIAFVVLFGGWEIGVRATHVSPLELVPPSSIFRELWHVPTLYLDNAWITLQEAFWGFLVAFVVAIGAAIVIAHSQMMERALMPIVVMLQVTPIIALGPPLVIWLGFGPQPKIVMAALITFVPLITNATVGFRAIDPAMHELMRSVNASKTEIFFRLRVPHSLPYLIAAAKVCVGLALVGSVVAEFVGSSGGLGYVMVTAQHNYFVAKVWAAIFVLIVVGVVLVGLVSILGHRLLRWAE